MLEEQITQEVAKSPVSPVSQSPFGLLTDTQSRKTFIDLIACMNASFPDYDFRYRPSHTRREPL